MIGFPLFFSGCRSGGNACKRGFMITFSFPFPDARARLRYPFFPPPLFFSSSLEFALSRYRPPASPPFFQQRKEKGKKSQGFAARNPLPFSSPLFSSFSFSNVAASLR